MVKYWISEKYLNLIFIIELLYFIAVKAGVDIVMVCYEYEHETDVYLGLLDAVNNG